MVPPGRRANGLRYDRSSRQPNQTWLPVRAVGVLPTRRRSASCLALALLDFLLCLRNSLLSEVGRYCTADALCLRRSVFGFQHLQPVEQLFRNENGDTTHVGINVCL